MNPAASRMAGLDAADAARLHAAARAIRDRAPAQAERLLDEVLARHPAQPEALRLRAILQLHARRPDLAAPTLLRALADAPGDALLQAELGNAHSALGRQDDAIAAWRRAAELDPAQASPLFNLGRAHQLRGDSRAAAEALARARELAPDVLPAAVLLGDALVHLGRFEDAAAQYRDALRLHPGSGDAWRGLASIGTLPLTGADAESLRAQLRRGDLSEADRIGLGHALGRLEEDRGGHAQALAAFADANARQRRLAPWSLAAFERFVDQALAASETLPAPLDPALGQEAIFIVGLPRSGSTLFEQVLAAHPEVEGASELQDLGSVLEQESRRRGRPYPQWVPDASAADWDRLGRDYLQRTARWRAARPRFTDKLPENWKLAGTLRAMLPGATVVETRRDPLETAWSCFKQPFFVQPHFACDFGDLAGYLRGCERAMDAWRARDPARIHLHRYEALVADPEAGVRRLLADCGLAFDPACLAPHRVARSVRTASAAQVRQPLRAGPARAATYGALLDPLRRALGLPAAA
jgi:tetratricopeptide (TPR) repeat protein